MQTTLIISARPHSGESQLSDSHESTLPCSPEQERITQLNNLIARLEAELDQAKRLLAHEQAHQAGQLSLFNLTEGS